MDLKHNPIDFSESAEQLDVLLYDFQSASFSSEETTTCKNPQLFSLLSHSKTIMWLMLKMLVRYEKILQLSTVMVSEFLQQRDAVGFITLNTKTVTELLGLTG